MKSVELVMLCWEGACWEFQGLEAWEPGTPSMEGPTSSRKVIPTLAKEPPPEGPNRLLTILPRQSPSCWLCGRPGHKALEWPNNRRYLA